MLPYFIFNGICSLDMGLVVTKLPTLSRAEEKVSEIELDGRHGTLTQTDNKYKNSVKSIECAMINGNVDKISAWLKGNGIFKFSHAKGQFFYGRITNAIDFERQIAELNEFIVVVNMQPFKYLQEGEETITITKPTKIINMGTFESEPLLRVYGSGNITLSNNNNNIILKDIKDYIIIDTFTQEAFKEGENCNNKMHGEPFIFTEINDISWIGNINKIEIIPRWRNL